MFDLQHVMGYPAPEREKSRVQPHCGPASPVSVTLVIALGNPLCGDDGVGVAVLDALAKSQRLPKNVVLKFDGSPDKLLVAILTHNCRSVYIIDSAFLQRSPGEWGRFTLQEVKLKPGDPNKNISMHNTGLAEVLELCVALKMKLPEIIIYGVQPMEVKWYFGLSDPVQKAVPGICASILDELQKLGVACEQ